MHEDTNSKGFYLLRRGWMMKEIFMNSTFCRIAAWVWLVERATYFDNERMRRGELLASYSGLAKEWGWSKDKVARFMRALRKSDMIRIETRGKRMSLVTICNYSEMQSPQKSLAAPEAEHFGRLKAHSRYATATPCNELNNNKDTTQLSLRERQIVEELYVILSGVIQDPRDFPALHDLTEVFQWKAKYDWSDFVVPTLEKWAIKNRQKASPTLITSYRYLTKILESAAKPKRKRAYFY